MERERIFDVIGIDKETDKVVVNETGVIAPNEEEALLKALENVKSNDLNKIKFDVTGKDIVSIKSYDIIGIDKKTNKVVVDETGIAAKTNEGALSILLKRSEYSKLDKNNTKFSIIYTDTIYDPVDNFKEDIEEALKENNELLSDVMQINMDGKLITNIEEAKKFLNFNYDRYHDGGKHILVWTAKYIYFDVTYNRTDWCRGRYKIFNMPARPNNATSTGDCSWE